MSILGLLCLLFALIAALILVLYGLQRRELRSIAQLSQQLQSIASGGRLPERVELGSDKAEIAGLVTAVNDLLTRAAAARSTIPPRHPDCSPTWATAFTKRCWCIAR